MFVCSQLNWTYIIGHCLLAISPFLSLVIILILTSTYMPAIKVAIPLHYEFVYYST